jgi:U3 small nucleolar RNA-associated protein 20
MATTLVLVRQAQEGIDAEDSGNDKENEDEDVEDKDDDDNDKGAVPFRSIRSTGLKRIVQFLRSNVVDYDFTPFLPALFKDVISPRLALLEIENTQAPSGTLDIIAALAISPETATSLVKFDERTLPKTYACMTAVKVKPAVIGRVFDVIEALLDEEEVVQSVLLPHIRPLLDNIIQLVA